MYAQDNDQHIEGKMAFYNKLIMTQHLKVEIWYAELESCESLLFPKVCFELFPHSFNQNNLSL